MFMINISCVSDGYTNGDKWWPQNNSKIKNLTTPPTTPKNWLGVKYVSSIIVDISIVNITVLSKCQPLPVVAKIH